MMSEDAWRAYLERLQEKLRREYGDYNADLYNHDTLKPFPSLPAKTPYNPDRNPELALEVLAFESRILTLADALVIWMRRLPFTSESARLCNNFIADPKYTTNPAGKPLSWTDGPDMLLLDKLDPDANKLLLELLRTAWHLRSWKQFYKDGSPT